jgi:type VI secretion system secreted protein VgrG
MPLSQAHRKIKFHSPLGDDVLLVTSFAGREEISRLFRFQLSMISEKTDIEAKDIVGKKVSFTVDRDESTVRHFSGFVSRFSAGDEEEGRRNYRAEVVPWLWFLTRTADCRIFQNLSVPDIIKQVFGDAGFSDFKLDLREQHEKWEYCVQYRETDFNFVSRLMEQEGIFFFFKHEQDKHVLHIVDNKGAYYDCEEKKVDFPLKVGTRAIKDHITSWEHEYEFPSGKWAQTDYNFETPSTSLLAQTDSVISLPDIKKYEVFDFPGEYEKKNEGDAETKLRMEEVEAAYDIVAGSSFCKSFMPGGKFTIGTHKSATEEGKSFVLTSVTHSAHELQAYESGANEEGGYDYHNNFTCIPASVVFRPARITPKPVSNGLQTAVVVGPAGEEIFVDKYGRVKVQFHWDRLGKKDENSSCWIRVSQTNAEKSFGAIHIPRIGAEVVISFIEGDPDRPLIVGRVYHAENMPPYGLPASKTISGIKSKTYKGSGYNEFVMDDTPGKELIREHGQFDKDSTIEHDLREHVLNDRTRDVTNNETITIGNDRTESVGHDETLTVANNRTESVGVNETLSVGSNRSRTVGSSETVTVTMNRTHTVGINEAITVGVAQEVTVGAARTVTVGGGQTISVGRNQGLTIGGNLNETVAKNRVEKITGNRTSNVGKNDTLSVGKKIKIDAGDEIVLQTGQASITMKKNGDIVIKGKDIKIEAMKKVSSKGMEVNSEASTKNVTKGAMVTVEASAINTIKGSLVKIN